MLLFLLLGCLCAISFAWVPPRPGSSIEWESVHDMRERLNITYDYTPSLLHPEICRYMTQEECQDGDESLKAHGRAHRKLQQDRMHNPNLGTIKVREQVEGRYYLSGAAHHLPCIPIQVLVLPIVFRGHEKRPLIDKADIEYMWNNLVPEWFDTNSFGNYDVEPYVADCRWLEWIYDVVCCPLLI